MPPPHERIDDVLDALDGGIARSHDADASAASPAFIARAPRGSPRASRAGSSTTLPAWSDWVVFGKRYVTALDAQLNGHATTLLSLAAPNWSSNYHA
jgi:hypothetical protein